VEVDIHNKETGKLVFTFINVEEVSLQDQIFRIEGVLMDFPLDTYTFKVSNKND